MQGVVALIGAHRREEELLAKRLERDGFEVVQPKPRESLARFLTQNHVRAILVSSASQRRIGEQAAQWVRQRLSRERIPLIVVASDDVAEVPKHLSGAGEIFRLHDISLAEAVRRLTLAMKLCQLTTSLRR